MGAEAPAEGPVKLYVGNLSWGMDDASLGDLFGEYNASEMTVEVDGRPLRVNISVARGDRPERAPRAPRGESSYAFDARKIYFGNLSWGMDHLDLQDLCGEFGTVEDSRLITDRETGRSRGFGFVTMSPPMRRRRWCASSTARTSTGASCASTSPTSTSELRAAFRRRID